MGDQLRRGKLEPKDLLIGVDDPEAEQTPEQRRRVETVQRSSEMLLSVINDVLDFSKIEAGRLDLEHVPFDLRATMDDIADLMAAKANDGGLELLVRVAPEVPRRAFTLSLDCHFTAAAEAGDRLNASARRTGGGRQVFFSRAEVHDQNGRLIAQGAGVFRYRGLG